MQDNIARQVEFEEKYSKKGRDALLHTEIDIDKMFFDVINSLKPLQLPEQGISKTIALYLEILCDPKEKHIQSIATRIGRRCGLEGVEAAKHGVEILELASDTGLYDVLLYQRSTIIRPLIRASDETLAKINTFNYLPPMIVPPKDWTNNHNGGYLTVPHEIILKTRNKHSQPVSYDVINKLQKIPLELDEYILFNFIETEDVEFNREIYVDFLDKWFYYMWQYDNRGRMYSAGYDINFQSTEFKKMLHNLSDKVLITI